MSVSLAPGFIEQYTVGGAAVETNDTLALTSMTVDWLSGFVSWSFSIGQIGGGKLTPGKRAAVQNITLNMATGDWTNGAAGNKGTITAQALALLNASLATGRNNIENAAMLQSLLPVLAGGTVTPWATS